MSEAKGRDKQIMSKSRWHQVMGTCDKDGANVAKMSLCLQPCLVPSGGCREKCWRLRGVRAQEEAPGHLWLH